MWRAVEVLWTAGVLWAAFAHPDALVRVIAFCGVVLYWAGAVVRAMDRRQERMIDDGQGQGEGK